MKRSRFSENQIAHILAEVEAGVPLNDLYRTHGFSWCSFLLMEGQVQRHGNV